MKVYYTTLSSPLGSLAAAATDDGLCMLEFSQRRSLIAFDELKRFFECEFVEAENEHLKKTRIQLQEYFAGTRKEFDIPLVYPGTDFQRKVWETLLQIPYGKTRTYKQQSLILNNPGAIRAVGSANGANRISIIIPCHRVIGEDGSLTGYAGGLHRKKWLLEHEGGLYPNHQFSLFEKD